MKKLLLILLCTGFSSSIFAQTIDSLRMLNNLEELAADKYEGRNTGEKGNDLARAYIIHQLEQIGVDPLDSTYEQAIVFWNWWNKKRMDGNNILAKVTGTKQPEKYIVISAHYDHIGIKKGKIYNGADDNASGTCALIELAAYFKQNPPDHSIIFAAFDAEEVGLQGAKCFIDEPPVPKDSIILNINMDMISRNQKSEIYICGTHHYPFLKKKLITVAKASPLTVLFGHDDPDAKAENWTSSSDHGAFHAEGIPFLYFGVEDHKDYHKHTDDFENIQPDFYYQAALLVLEATKQLDKL